MPTKSTTFLLVRHGATATTGKVLPGRAPGLHLATKGVDQAQAVAARLRELSPAPSALYVSPLERTRETAAPIAKALGLRARVERGLLECDFGQWTGKRLSALRTKPEWRAVRHAPSTFRFPEGESFVEMQTRMWATLERLARAHPGARVVVVSHADPIKAAVTYAQGVPLDLFQRTVISTCSVSALTLGAHGPIVLSVNNTGSLRELVAS
ncbi:MAG: histidine phosphatase family protein [Acidobacteriota bacterium]|nr:histidine phosphatase family protein [Acidobacteriota bacterium]